MNKKDETTKKAKEKKIKINNKMLILIITIIVILVAILTFAIFKWQNVKNENNKHIITESINKKLYTDMTSKKMYEETRQLDSNEKKGLLEVFIKKWKQDKYDNIDTIADNETYARYLFCQ